MHPLVQCCACTSVHGRWEVRRPWPTQQSLPSQSRSRSSPLHCCWTRAHPHVSPPGRSHACCPAVVGATLLSVLKRLVTPSYSSALNHNFLLSPQKLYFLLGVLSSSFFHPSKADPPLLTTQRKEGEPPLISLWHRKAALTWADTQGCGTAHSLWAHNSSQLAFLPKFQCPDLQVSP